MARMERSITAFSNGAKKTMGPILNKSQFIGLTSQVGNALITFIL